MKAIGLFLFALSMPIHGAFGNFRQVQHFPYKAERLLYRNPSYIEILSRIPRYENLHHRSVSRDFILISLQLTQSRLTSSDEAEMALNNHENQYLPDAIKNLDQYLKDLTSLGLIEEVDTDISQSY